MPRRAAITRRPLTPDPVYDNSVVTQLINKVLRDGKKSVAERTVYDALERIRDRTGRDPVQVMEEAIRNVTPVLEVKSRRVGGATYQVPIEVPARRGRTLAFGEINLRLPALIPDDYLPDVHARLILYKRIASAEDERALNELQVEMIDRFGLLPEPAKHLMRLTLLKLKAERLGIRKVEAGPQGGRIEFAADTCVDPLTLIQLIQGQPARYKLEGGTAFKFQVPMERPEQRFNTLEALLERLTPPAA